MCGDTGVSTRQRSAGDAIGPRTENEYAVVPVGVATITPSAAYVVNGLPLIDTSSRIRWPLRCFSSAASLSANHVPAAGPARLDVDREHHALRHREVAREQPRQRRVELVGLDLGEVAELADVHAEDRDRRRVHEVDRVQHRAVAAERDHEVEAVGEAVGLDAELVEADTPSPRLAGRAPRRRARRNHAAAARASSCATPRSRCGTRPTARIAGLMRLDTGHVVVRGRPDRRSSMSDVASTAAGPRARVREELDVAVGAAQRRRDHRAHTEPERVEPADDFAQHRVVHHRVAHDATLADARPARLELRLHEQHEVGIGVREREQVRRDRAQRDERQVGDAQVGGRIDRAGVELAHVRALHHGDARVVAQRPRELAPARRRSRRRARRRVAAGSR